MNKLKLGILISMALLETSSWANLNVGDVASPEAVGAFNIQAPALSANLDGIYLFNSFTTLEPVRASINGHVVPQLAGPAGRMSFEKHEAIAVRFLKNGDLELTALLSPEEYGILPDTITVTPQSFGSHNLIFVGAGGVKELQANFSPYVETQDARARGKHSMRSRLHWGGAQGCVAYVLRAIHWHYGKSGNGRSITATLRKVLKYQTASCSETSGPEGAVGSWTGGDGSGHTAIVQGGRFCYDEGCKPPGAGYTFIGCVAPPGGSQFASAE